MVFSLTWLPRVLENAGLKVSEVPDWRSRGRSDMKLVRGVMVHHTAGARTGNMPSLDLLVRGRPDLSGPLAQLGLGRDGTFYVIAAGRANHAGIGKWRGIATGNSSFIGIEAENTGRADDPWPEVQLEALRHGTAALLAFIKADSTMVCGHKEFALPAGRKSDPLFSMSEFREAVAAILTGRSPPLALIPAADPAARPTLRRGARGEIVRLMQTALGKGSDGIFGPATEAAVRQFQRNHQLVPDGIFGPKSWEAIGAAHQSGVPTSTLTVPAAPVTATAKVGSTESTQLPVADDAAHPVRVEGSRAVTPDGHPFARRHKLGFVQLGHTSVSAFANSNPAVMRGISPSAIRVVGAVTGNEGMFEAINSYDSAFLSVGIMQWTVGEKNASGELAGLLALIQSSDPAAFQECYGRFGIGVAMDAGSITGFLTLNGEALDSSGKKQQLRSPEWAYRFWRAAHQPAVRRLQLQLAVNRIGRFSGIVLHGHRLGEWLSSELGIAMILDQHVNRPGHVPKTLDSALIELLTKGQVESNPANWDRNDEDRLLDRYVEIRAGTSMTNQLARANRLIQLAERGELSADRGSFA